MIRIDEIKKLLDDIVSRENLPINSLQFIKQDNRKDGEWILQIFEPEFPLPLNGTIQGVTAPVLLLKDEHGKTFEGQNKVNIIIKKFLFESTEVPTDCQILKGSGNDYVKVRICEDNPEYLRYIKDIVKYRLNNYYSKSSFACCSKFEDCSKEGKCLHENRLYATGCIYWLRHLRKGERAL